MAVYRQEFTFTTEYGKVYDITAKVLEVVEASGIKDGLVNIFAPHATGVLFLGEIEPNIAKDYWQLMEKLAPFGAGWAHDTIDSNAHAHLRSFLIGTSLVVPLARGRLLLGTWQRIGFLETDGHRLRRVVVTVVGE